MANDVTISGGGIGIIVAVVLSWITWHSVPWLIVNGAFGWFYVIYWALHYWK